MRLFTTAGRTFTTLFGAALLLVCVSGCRRPPAPKTIASNGYVDPAACATCHADIARTYRLTGMGRSFHRMARTSTAADFQTRNTYDHKPSQMSYTLRERDGAFYQDRQTIGYNGTAVTYEKSIDYVIGSGNHAQTFLHRTPEGKLIELPVSWYTELGGYWAMSPGYDRPGQMDFRRTIGTDCMFCHNGYPAFDAASASRAEESVFPGNLPDGIDCQRCHGPGASHVKAAQANAGNDAIRAAIVNPAHLDRDRQMAICQQCHLETTSLRLPNMLRRTGRSAYSFRPGEPLTDYAVYFDHKPDTGFDDRFEVAHQAYRLAKSQCFLKSQMTCTTCHNPHQIPRGEAATTHYNTVCQSCHQQPHPAVRAAAPINSKSNCVDCHMGKRRVEDAVHVVMTDHYIQRLKPKRDLLAPIKEIVPAYHDEVTDYLPKVLSQIPEGDLYHAAAQVIDGTSMAELPRLRSLVEQQKPKEADFYNALALAYTSTGDDNEAAHWFSESLARPGHSPATQRELSAALARAHQFDRAANEGEKAVAAEPRDTTAITNLGNIYLQQGRTAEAQSTLARALAIDPELADANNLLGLAALRLNDTAAAEQAWRKALLIDPTLAEANNNLGTLYASRGDLPQAEFYKQAAIAADPTSAAIRRSYAMMLATNRQFDRAAGELREALRLNPQAATAQASGLHVDLADVLVASGRIPEALKEYTQAAQLNPKEARAHIGLANINNAQNRPAQAEQEFRLATTSDPGNGEAHLGLAELLARRGAIPEARHELEQAAQSNDPNARETARRALTQ